jgi:hypothetical protein
MNYHAKRMECVQLAGAVARWGRLESGSKLHALQTLRAAKAGAPPLLKFPSPGGFTNCRTKLPAGGTHGFSARIGDRPAGCFHPAGSRSGRKRGQTSVIAQEGGAGQAHGFGDGGLGDLAATPSPDDKVPGQASFHIGQHVGNENARSFERRFAVADHRVGDNVSRQFHASVGTLPGLAHGGKLHARGGTDKAFPASVSSMPVPRTTSWRTATRGRSDPATSVTVSCSRQGLKNRQASDIFVSMKTITKRELVRNPALASHLRPGESVQLEDGKEPLVILRRKKRTLTAEDIHAELDRICKGAPEMDTLAVLNDLRE